MRQSNYNQDTVSTLGYFLLSRDIVKDNWKILFKENGKKYLKLNKVVLSNVPEIR
jgi:hypothetical protein